MDYKLSFYNINVYEEGYTDNPNYKDLYYNTMSNKFAEIPEGFNPAEPSEKLEELKEKRMIVPTSLNEAENYRTAQIKAIENEYPTTVSLVIAVTTKCNYQCEYCFQNSHKNGVDMQGEVLQDTIAYIKKEIDRNNNLKTFRIRWFGGEPLMNMQAIREISNFVIPYCKERNLKYEASIITNGYLFTKEISNELNKLSVTKVQIAIDGFENDYIAIRKAPKDAYKRVLQNIEDSVIPVTIRLNTTRNNKEDIIELLKELSQFDSVKNKHNTITIARVKEYDYAKTLRYGFTDQEWLKFRECRVDYMDVLPIDSVESTVRLIPCPHNQKRNIILSADGFLYRCDFHFGYKNYAIGTIKDGISVNNIVDKDYLCSTIDTSCLKCRFLPLCCGGACRYGVLKQGKSCSLIEGRFKQNMQNYLTYVYNKNESNP